MSLTGRTECHDRSEVITGRFNERRKRELRRLATPEVVAEFRRDVEGRTPRSLALRHLLNFMRMTPIEGRVFAYAAAPFSEYYVGRLRGARGASPEIDESTRYSTEADAVFAAFMRRLADIRGTSPENGSVR